MEDVVNMTNKPLTSIVASILMLTLIGNLAACGTILYPERKGQKPGQIDPAVAILDGVGLLFWIIPGVIAFAVDFSNNSIYLPQGHSSKKFSQFKIDGKMDMATIENFVRAETGKTVDLQQSNVAVTRLDSAADLDSRFSWYGTHNHIALAQ
jgi:hypothetical protein